MLGNKQSVNSLQGFSYGNPLSNVVLIWFGINPNNR